MKTHRVVVSFLIALTLALASGAWGEPTKKQYVVKGGDTLGDIIWTLRAQGIDVTKLGEWNPGLGTQVMEKQKITYYVPEIKKPAPQISKAEMEQAVNQAVAAINQRYRAERQRTRLQKLSRRRHFFVRGTD
jgi:hypothetical protein